MTDSWFCAGRLGAVALTCATLAWSPSSAAAADVRQPTFATPDAAVAALITAVRAGSLDDILAVFGPEGKDLVDSSIRPPAVTIARSSPSPSRKDGAS